MAEKPTYQELEAQCAALSEALMKAQDGYDFYTGDASVTDWIDDVMQDNNAGRKLIAQHYAEVETLRQYISDLEHIVLDTTGYSELQLGVRHVPFERVESIWRDIHARYTDEGMLK